MAVDAPYRHARILGHYSLHLMRLLFWKQPQGARNEANLPCAEWAKPQSGGSGERAAFPLSCLPLPALAGSVFPAAAGIVSAKTHR